GSPAPDAEDARAAAGAVKLEPKAATATGAQDSAPRSSAVASTQPGSDVKNSAPSESAPPATKADPPLAATWLHSGLVGSGAAAVALLVASVAFLAIRRRRAAAAAPPLPGSQATDGSEKRRLDDVRAACKANDPRAARDALVGWARIAWPKD